MTTTSVEIRQLADNNGGISIIPITAPEAILLPNGENLNSLLGNDSLITSSQTFTGAINELANLLKNYSNPNMSPETTALANYNSGTVTYTAATQTWKIVSAVTTSTWGSGAQLTGTTTAGPRIPYGYSYRASMEVKVPTAHTITIDCNNYACSGTSWSGNDNDLTSTRVGGNGTGGIIFSIPANKWTKIWWGYKNIHSGNTDQVPIYIVDGIGLNTNADSASVTWYIRNVKTELGEIVTPYTYR